MATISDEASTFFGVIQRIYTLFSSSTKRWQILKTYVKDFKGKDLTLKLWSDTRWESRVASVKAIIFQTPKIKDALLYLAKNSNVHTKSDAESLVETGLEKYDFLVGMVIWFDILRKLNKVSKPLQGKDMNIDIAIDLLKGLILFFDEYSNIGFENAKIEAERIALELDYEPKFREICIRHKKKFFDEITRDEPVQNAKDCFRINCFLKMVDSALSILKTRFKQFEKYEETFGFLFNLHKLRTVSEESLKSSCLRLEKYLKRENDDISDFDEVDLFLELQILKKILPKRISNAIEVLESITNKHVCYPNALVSYRIILTIPVTVATVERSFSKLKLLKNYLRLTMSQERLNGLAMLSIEKKMLAELDFGELIVNFANQKVRKISV